MLWNERYLIFQQIFFYVDRNLKSQQFTYRVFFPLQKEVSFSIDPSDSTILDKHFSDTIGYTDVPLQPPAPREAWPWGEEEQNGPANIENDPPSHPGSHPETDAQGSLAVENDDAANLQSPLSPSPPSQAPPAPPAPPPPPAPPSSQVVDLPLDDIAVGKFSFKDEVDVDYFEIPLTHI